jgi:hypothetical protein
MKKFFLICVALIAFLATNASGGNQYQTDQLRTCYVTQASPQIMPVYNFVAPEITPVISYAATPAQTTYFYSSISETDGWRAPVWIPSLLAVSNNKSNVISKNIIQIPILTLNSKGTNRMPDNYNVNYSYGLRN